MSKVSQPVKDKPSDKPKQYFPGRSWLLIIGFELLAIVIIRNNHDNIRLIINMFDEAVLNMVSTGLGVLAFFTFTRWFIWYSDYPVVTRRIAFWTCCVALAALPFSVRLEGVTGNMVMKFQWRWVKPKDALLSSEGFKKENLADLSKVAESDITGFLGNDRNNYQSSPKLDKDWEANPPKLKWRQPIGAGWSAFVVVNGFAVTMEQRGEDEIVACYKVESGEPVWKYSVKSRHEHPLGGIGPRSTPTIHNGKVYSLGAAGHLACLDGATGKPIWTKDLLKEQAIDQSKSEGIVLWGRAASCLIVDGKVVVPLGGIGENVVSLVAYDAESGQEQWRGGTEQISYASPILAKLDGVRQIVIVNEASVTGHDVSTGKTLWKHAWPGSSSGNASSSIPHVVDKNRLLLSKGYGQGCEVIELSNTDGNWTVTSVAANPKSLMTKYTNVTIIDDHVYGLSDGIMECVSLPDLKRKWKTSAGRFGHGQVLGVGDVILVQTEQQEEIVLVAANPSKLEILGKIPGPVGKSWNNFCLVGNLLLARSEEEAICYELPLAK